MNSISQQVQPNRSAAQNTVALPQLVEPFAGREAWQGDALDILRTFDDLQRQAGRADVALHAIARSISANVTNPQFFYTLGCSLRRRRRWQHAADHFRRAVQIKPDFVEALVGWGAVLREQGRFDAAEDALCKALEFHPDDAQAHFELAATHLKREQHGQAEHHLRQAVACDPAHGHAWSQLGSVLERRGDTKEALHCFTRAVEQNRGTASVARP